MASASSQNKHVKLRRNLQVQLIVSNIYHFTPRKISKRSRTQSQGRKDTVLSHISIFSKHSQASLY